MVVTWAYRPWGGHGLGWPGAGPTRGPWEEVGRILVGREERKVEMRMVVVNL